MNHLSLTTLSDDYEWERPAPRCWPGPPPAPYRDPAAVEMMEGDEPATACEIEGADTPIDLIALAFFAGLSLIIITIVAIMGAPHLAAWARTL